MARKANPMPGFVGSGKNGIRWTTDTLTPGINSFGPKLNAAIAATMVFYEPRVQDYARSNAKWQDQTSNARNSLSARAYTTPNAHGIILSHGVPYGIWLEVRWNGKYAIIVPTIITQGRALMLTLGKLLSRMGRAA